MKYLIIVTSFVSLIACMSSCQNPQKNMKANAGAQSQHIEGNCLLFREDGADVVSKLQCKNCHIHGDGHLTDSSYLSDYGKKQTVNLNELSRLDSAHIRKYLISGKHNNLYKNDVSFSKLSECEIRNMIFYLRRVNEQFAIQQNE